MSSAIVETNLNFPGLKSKYVGKVRDVYHVGEYLVMVATDRISAFDIVLPEGIPYKGQVLNQIAEKFLDATRDIVPNWKLACPDPNVTVGHYMDPFKVEMVIRGYLTGHAWRQYRSGHREICGVSLPENMIEHQRFPKPIITPTTKADVGHDEDISKEEILSQGLVQKEDYEKLEDYTIRLFECGTRIAEKMGLILVDTKYEFGKRDGEVFLIDEIHTPDSSRYFYLDGYDEKQENNIPQKQLSKEFVREWLMEQGFQGKVGQSVPEMGKKLVDSISDRYIELFESITGSEFQRIDLENAHERIEKAVSAFLESSE